MIRLVPTYRKVCLMGDFAVGKSSLVRRFVNSAFDDRYVSTIGVRVVHKVVNVAGDERGEALTMMLWDMAGSEELDHGQESYLHGVAGAVLVCDLTRPETLATLRGCADQVLCLSPSARLILAANKCDLADRQHRDLAPVEALAASLDAPYYLTSAKTGEGVDRLFKHLMRLVMRCP